MTEYMVIFLAAEGTYILKINFKYSSFVRETYDTELLNFAWLGFTYRGERVKILKSKLRVARSRAEQLKS
jgi:hypothetical protein